MNFLANRIAVAIKNANSEDTYSIEIMQYSLNIILNTCFIILATALIGIVTGHFSESLIFLFSFSLLRLSSGGFHLKTATACNIVTIFLSTASPFLSIFSEQYFWFLSGISFLIIVVFAPNPDKNARIPLKIYPALKLISIILAGSNFLIHSSVVGLAFFVQSLTVIKQKKEVIT
ncbi:accessory gene regulator B family protein [Paenibacillus sonchi]|uniref:Accessory gene regulator B family protein n=1 Tax=Paenibacillus sonchi TaxID=373687 RepID=A0A974PCG2_9BACL|nr:accessory gene regulator B family protein [Paenibacillus sonchi]QQZ60833.1 accessory gene regulator B family protein [Paenibacillus sonchi]